MIAIVCDFCRNQFKEPVEMFPRERLRGGRYRVQKSVFGCGEFGLFRTWKTIDICDPCAEKLYGMVPMEPAPEPREKGR